MKSGFCAACSAFAAVLFAGRLCAELSAQQTAGPDPAAVERCKAAVAHIRPRRGGRGSAFCVHRSGLFLASQHVLKNSDSAMLIFNSGTPAERSVLARLVRSDAAQDLVLLLAAEGKDFVPLELSSATNVVERMEVAAFGFPHIPGSLPPTRNPAVKIDLGRVIALKKKQGARELLETDVTAYIGNSGGPLVDKSGRVAGAVTAGIPGKSLSFAIPVDSIRAFLARPVIVFDPPAIMEKETETPVAFECRVIFPLDPAPRDLSVRLAVRTGADSVRIFDLVAQGGGVYGIIAAPCAPGAKEETGAQELQYTLTVARAGKLVGTVEAAVPLASFEKGLISLLTFSEGRGTTAADSSGRGHPAMLLGNPAWLRDVSDGVVMMDGADDVMELQAGREDDASRGRSLVVRLRAMPGGKGMWIESGAGHPLPELLERGALPGWPDEWGSVTPDMIGPMQTLPAKPLADGAWHDVALLLLPEDRAEMWLDGERILEGTVRPRSKPVTRLHLGRVSTGPGTCAYFRGQIDEVRLYDRVLTPGEIKLLFRRRGVAAKPARE